MQDNDQTLFDQAYEERIPDFKNSVNIAVIGKVSTGKSSLINAILERDRTNMLAKVGAVSGVTTEIKIFKLDDHVKIIDAPGLDDIQKENSDETQQFLQHIDIGILVVTGSADASQKHHYDALRERTDKIFVVLNKIDAWDDLEENALQGIVDQWKMQLGGIDHIYPTNTKGYDPQARKDTELDLRGVTELRNDILNFLKESKKELLLAKNMADKKKYASKIIASALLAVATEAFIPGSAVYITTTQVVAIASLQYLYTGEAMNKQSALALIPRFAGQSLGTSIFLWSKSFLPPTGVVDVAAAAVAVSITFAMLAAVNYLLQNNIDLLSKASDLTDKFNEYKKYDISTIINAIKDGKNIVDIINKILS